MSKNHIIESINTLNQQYEEKKDPVQVYTTMLGEFISMSESAQGFIAELNNDGVLPASLTPLVSSVKGMKIEPGMVMEKIQTAQTEFSWLADHIKQALNSDKPYMATIPGAKNGKQNAAGNKEASPDNPEHSLLSLPLIAGQNMIGLVCLMDRPGGYDKKLADYLSPLCSASSHIASEIRQGKQLAENESVVETLLTLGNPFTAVLDANGHLGRINNNFSETLDVPKEAIQSTPFIRFVHPDDKPSVKAVLSSLTSQSGELNFDCRMKVNTGEYLDIRWRAASVGSGLVGINGEYAKSEISREGSKTAREIVPLAYLKFDKNGALRYYSPQAEELFAKEKVSLKIGETMESIYSELATAPNAWSNEESRAFVSERMEAFQSPGISTYRKLPSGTWWMEVDHPGLEEDTESVALIIDQTGLIKNKGRQQRKRTTQTIGQLTGGMAHYFNNLLTVIMGNLEMVSPYLGTNPKGQIIVQRALSAGERGADLIQQLLSFSKNQRLKSQSTDINRLILNLGSRFRENIPHNIEVQTKLSNQLDIVTVDKEKFEESLLHLVSNAGDAMPDGGVLTLTTENIDLKEGSLDICEEIKPGNYVMVSVQDTGQGIDRAVRDKIFDPFFTTKEVGKGNGLGLSVFHGFIHQSGGYLTVISESGKGATFNLYLPAIKAEEKPETLLRTKSQLAVGQGEKILLVEDDPGLRLLYVDILEKLGYVPFHAETGPAALDLLKNTKDIELLFTDIELPGGLNGVDLAETARKMQPDLKVLFTTGHTKTQIQKIGALNKEDFLIEKPYRVENLAMMLRALLHDK